MLRITIPSREKWDERKCEFLYSEEQTLDLEHSLVSISKWESKWNKPFLTEEKKTLEETIDYVRCMTITENVSPDAYYNLTDSNMKEISSYIQAPMTATWFNENFSENKKTSKKKRAEQITSEMIYYWLVALQIPFQPCENWHLNRLLTLIKICNIKNSEHDKNSKQTPREAMKQNAALNAARRQKLHTKG